MTHINNFLALTRKTFPLEQATIFRLLMILLILASPLIGLALQSEHKNQPVADENFTRGESSVSRSATRAELDVTEVTLVDGENTTSFKTTEPVLRDALAEENFTRGEHDQITPSLDTPLTGEKTTVTVERATQLAITETTTTPFEKTTVEDPNMFIGESQVVQPGSDGVSTNTYETWKLEDGTEVKRDLTLSISVSQPVPEVTAVGTKEKPKPTSVPAPAAALKPTVVGDPTGARAIAKEMVLSRGWDESQYVCLDNLWQKESGWRVEAENKSSGAYGIPQSLPGKKMASVGSDWQTNPATQITWGLNYISGRYSTPCGAWEHSQLKGWY